MKGDAYLIDCNVTGSDKREHPTIKSFHFWHSFVTKFSQRLASWLDQVVHTKAIYQFSKVIMLVLMSTEHSTPSSKTFANQMDQNGSRKRHRCHTATILTLLFSQ
jgi:hypothetical protein